MRRVPVFNIVLFSMLFSTISAPHGSPKQQTNFPESVLFGHDGKFAKCCPQDTVKFLQQLQEIYRSIINPPSGELSCTHCRLHEAISKHIQSFVSENLREASQMIVDEEFLKHFTEKHHEMKEDFYRGEESLKKVLEVQRILANIEKHLGITKNALKVTKGLNHPSTSPLTPKELNGIYNRAICQRYQGEIPMMKQKKNTLKLILPTGDAIDVFLAENENSFAHFYARVHKCLKSSKELAYFNENLQKWILRHVLPVLEKSEQVLPAFGAIFRISATIEKERTKPAIVNFYSQIYNKVSGIPNKTMEIVGVIALVMLAVLIFILTIWCCIWRARKSSPHQWKYNKLKSSAEEDKEKLLENVKNVTSGSSGEEIELFSRNSVEMKGRNSDSLESLDMEAATVVHMSPRRKIFS